MKKQKKLIIVQLIATALFIWNTGQVADKAFLSWAAPLALILLIVINSIWFTRSVSWVIFAGSFFAFLILLSAFTLRWRLEPGFSSVPFYRSILMYASFIYVSLAQLKILGDAAPTQGDSNEPSK